MVEHAFDESLMLDRNLALEAVRVTEAAALSASNLIGRGDEKEISCSRLNAPRFKYVRDRRNSCYRGGGEG